jgi:hypothetical protein
MCLESENYLDRRRVPNFYNGNDEEGDLEAVE